MRAVLMYHSLDDSGSPISVAPSDFERHLDWLVANSVPVRSFSEFARESTSGDSISLTFDDAFTSFASEAWPRLRDRGLPATVFVVSGRCGRTNRWQNDDSGHIPELPLLDWDQLARLAEEGCELGCHTQNHQHLTDLTAEQVEKEIASSLEEIEQRTGHRPTTLAYPYGDHNAAVADQAARLVESACTTEFSLVTADTRPMEIPRLDAWYFSRPGLFESFGRPKFAAFVKRRRFLRRLKRAVLRD